MKIDELTLCAFRGIPGKLRLNLTSPVTLLYAPNGSGKTSICDGLEWLLTGRVGRMGHNLGTASKDLRCLFSQDHHETFAEAEICEDGRSKYIRRVFSERGSHVTQRTKNEWRNYTSSEFLKWCAPLAPQHARSGPIPAEDNRLWLRATHFFESSSLRFLIEDSEEAEETRLLLFAKLLGIGEIESRIQLFDRLLKPLRQELKRRHREIVELKKRFESRQNEASAASNAPTELKKRAEDRLRSLEEILGLHLPDSPDARVALETAGHHLEKKRHALRHLRVKISDWSSLGARVEESRKINTALVARTGEDRKEIAAVEKALGEASATYSDHTSRLEAIEALATKAGKAHQELDLVDWVELPSGPLIEEMQLARLRSTVESLQRKFEDTRDREDELRRCCEELPGWQRDRGEERQLAERIGKLREELDPDEILGERRREQRHLAEARDEVLREQDELSEALNRLRQLFATEDDSRESDPAGGPGPAHCPLCGHDHGEPEALRRAIGTAVEATPDALRLRSRRIEAIQKEMASHQKHLEEQEELRQRIAECQERQAAIATTMAKAQQRLEAAFRVPVRALGDLEDPSLTSRLERLLAEVGEEVKKLWKDTRLAEQRLQVATNLSGVRVALAEIRERLAQVMSTAQEPIPRQPSAWRAWLEEIEILVEQARRKETDYAVKAAAQKERLLLERDAVKNRLAEAANRLASLRQDLEEILEERAKLEESWNTLEAPEPSPSEAGLNRLEADLERRREDLKRAGQALVEAEGFMREAKKAEKAQREVDDLGRDIAERRRQHAKIDAWIHDLSDAHKALEVESKKYIQDQIAPLDDLISTIFGRAQSNEVIDRIDPLRKGAGPVGRLRWRLSIGGKRLSIAQLSSGQCQDLALAIFLARARSLGGSFLLDEPLVHLDDLNRVALLDILRVLALNHFSGNSAKRASPELRLVITTASSALMSHLREKFSLVPWSRDVPPLRIYELEGGPRTGVSKREIRIPEDPSLATWRLRSGGSCE